MKLICKQCEKEFKDSHKERRYCSKECYSESREGIKPVDKEGNPIGFTTETAKKYGFKKGNKCGFEKGYTPWNKGLKIGTSGMEGKKHTEKSKRKMSRNNPKYWEGRRFSEEHKRKLSENHADFSESRSPNWKGEDVGYGAIHQWVRNQKGSPRKCDICGTTEATTYDWANINHKYERKLDDYIRLCRPCHRDHDIKLNNYKRNE